MKANYTGVDSCLLGFNGSLPTPGLRLTARTPKQKFQASKEEYRDPKWDVERRLAGAMLITSLRDYHHAKKFIKKNNIAFRYHCRKSLSFLTDTDRQLVMDGKEAHEWLFNEPVGSVKDQGWTLNKVCDLLKLDIRTVREVGKKASTSRLLDALNGQFSDFKGDPRGRRSNRRGTGSKVSTSSTRRASASKGVAGDRGRPTEAP